MGWERGYYYRARKVNGKVVKEYIGRGRSGELAARLDALDRDARELTRIIERIARAEAQGGPTEASADQPGQT